MILSDVAKRLIDLLRCGFFRKTLLFGKIAPIFSDRTFKYVNIT